jgi:putative ABC transport system permease protein
VREIRREESTDSEESDEIGIREYFVNYRNAAEGLVAGESMLSASSLYGAPEKDIVRLSLEKEFAKRIDASVGQRLTLELGGVPLHGRVDSLREVNWFNFNPNFFILASGEDLEGAPRSWIGLARISTPEVSALQAKFVSAAPQTVSLDSRAIAAKVSEILDKVDAAIFWVGIFLLLTLVVLVWGIGAGRLLDWPQENLLFRSMGLSVSKQKQLLILELLVIWAMAAVFSLILSCVMSWVLSRELFKFPLWWPGAMGWMRLVAGIILMALFSLFSLGRGLKVEKT